MKKILFIVAILSCFAASKVQASHAAGAELLYSYISGNDYKFTLKFYRDCTGINEPASFNMCWANTCNNTSGSLTLNKVSNTGGFSNGAIVNTGCDSTFTSCAGGTIPGFREWVYEGTMALNTQCILWKFYVVESARNPQYNITGGNLYVDATLDNVNAQYASSPTFTFKPVPYLCLNQPTTYNNGAIDPNGDSLSFESITPQTLGGTCVSNPAPTNCGINVGNMPTYNPATNPIPNTAFSISNTTGLVSVTPSVVSNNVLTVIVKKWRGGILVGTVRRDIQVAIVNCAIANPTSVLSPASTSGLIYNGATGTYDACVNDTISFCVDIFGLPDTSVLKVLSNANVVLPGAIQTITGYGTDSVKVCLSWIPGPLDSGLHVVTILYSDTNCTYNLTAQVISYSIPIYVIPTVFAEKDSTICAGDTMRLKAFGGSSFTWQALPGGSGIASMSCTNCNAPFVWPTVTTSYVVTSNFTSVCGDNIDTVTVTVGQIPSITAGTDTNLCTNSSYVIDATSTNPVGQVFSWSPTTFLSNPNVLSPTINNPQADITYVLTVVDGTTPCAARDTLNINVLTPVNILNNDTIICKGKSVQINAAGDPLYTYSWSPNVFISNPNIKNTLFTPDTNIVYTLTSSYFTCPDVTESINIQVQEIPTVTAGADRLICVGDTAQLLATCLPLNANPTFYTYAWSPVGDLTDPATLDPIFDGQVSTDLQFIATTSIGCADTDNVFITVVNTDFLNPIPGASICPGFTASIAAGGTNVVSYLWQPGHGVSDSTAASVVLSPEATTTYTLYGSDVNGCKDTLYSTVYVAQAAVLFLGNDTTIYPGESMQFDPQTNCTQFTYAPPAGLSATNIANPIAQPSVSTQYVVNATNDFGCVTSDTIVINVSAQSLINTPNAFAPTGNKDAANGTFKADKRGIATLNSFKIYNRWGNLVFETTDINEGWDGTYNGMDQPMGTYIYIIDAKTSDGKKFSKTSNVTLIR